MSAVKLLANSAVVCNCYIVLNMTSIFMFHISHTTWGTIDYSWKLWTMFQQVILNYGMFMLNSNEPNQSCSPSEMSQSINVEWCTCGRNGR